MSNSDNTSQFLLPTKSLISLWENKRFVFVATVLATLCLLVLIGGQMSINLWYMLNIACVLTIIAYRFPYLTIVLVFLLGQIIGHEAQLLLPENLRKPALGPLNLRYFDPIVLGIVFAVLLKLLHRDKILLQFLFRDYLLWTLLLGWLTIGIIRSLGTYNIINTLGEFRTYYQYMLLIPYIVVFFQTENDQWRLFKLLIVLSSLFLFSGILRGWMFRGFEIGFGIRWFTASANLALLNGMIALYFVIKQRLIKINSTVLIVLFAAFFCITIISNIRSVWLATIVAIIVVLLLGQFSVRIQILSIIGILIALVIANYLLTIYNIDFLTFIKDRSKPFYDYRSDPTASWRYYVWIEALKRIKESPFFGFGLGRHFQLYFKPGHVITTSPHNLYISITYQLGFVGLFLYLSFLVQIFYRFRKALTKGITNKQFTIVLTGSTILFSSSAYYIAYNFDYFTWLYIGLGIASIMKVFNSKKET